MYFKTLLLLSALLTATMPAVVNAGDKDDKTLAPNNFIPTNNSSNNNTNTAGGGAGGTATQAQSANISNYNGTASLYYPDWLNTTPSGSAVSHSSAQCQGPTLSATASALTTNAVNGYGVQGAIGFSVPLGGQADCLAVQRRLRQQLEFKAAAEQALMCQQLINAKVDINQHSEFVVCGAQR